MASCFGTLKTGPVHQVFPQDAARHDLFASMEGYYNRQRLHSTPSIAPPNRQSAKSSNPVSTKSKEGQTAPLLVSRRTENLLLLLARLPDSRQDEH
jgi:hypothetical protein